MFLQSQDLQLVYILMLPILLCSLLLSHSKVKRAWPGAMGDRPGSSSRVRTSEDKARRKDLCWSVRAVYILEKLPDVSGPGLREAGRYRMVSKPTLAVSRTRVS